MPLRRLKKLMPNEEQLGNASGNGMLSRLIRGNPEIWRFNRRSVSLGAAIGLFVAWIPLPLQMIIAAATAIRLRANVAIAILCVFITNPLTMLPMFWMAYKVGGYLLGEPAATDLPNHVDHHEVLRTFFDAWQPLLLGSFLFGVLSAAIGFASLQLAWLVTHRQKRARNQRFKLGLRKRREEDD